MIYVVSTIIIIVTFLVAASIIVVNVRRHREITGKHRLNRPEVPDKIEKKFPEFKGPVTE